MKLVSVKFITETPNYIFCDLKFTKNNWLSKRIDFTKRYRLEKHNKITLESRQTLLKYKCESNSHDDGIYDDIRYNMILSYQRYLQRKKGER